MGFIQFQIALLWTQQSDNGMCHQQQADGKGSLFKIIWGNKDGFPTTDTLRMYLILSAVSAATQCFVYNKVIFYCSFQ